MDSAYCENEYEYPAEVPVEDGLRLYGGGDHPGPAQPDTSKPVSDERLGSAPGLGYDFATADLPR